ncbi:MAG TPA: AI-2E family transporter, partial [Pirellulales bacterium]|nr:AI-2E family transporter [Pirellulales bacterium]
MQRIASFIVLIAIVGVVGFLAFEVLAGFLLPLFIALLLVVMFRPVHHWLSRRLRGRERLAAGITTLCVLLIFLLPLLWFVSRAATDTLALVSEFDPHSIARGATRLRQRFDLESPPPGVEQALAEVETSLNRLRSSATPAAEFAKEADLRKDELNALGTSTTRLIDELWPTTAPPAEDDEAKNRDLTLQASIADFQGSLMAINNSIDDQARLTASLRDAQTALDHVHTALYGGPIKRWLRQFVKFDETQVTQLHGELQSIARPLAVGTTQFLGSFLLELLIGISVMVVSFYYFLADGPLMTKAIMSLTPLDSRYEVQLLHEFGQLTRAILVAMLLSALVQGALASLGYALAGFDSIFLLSVLTMVFAIVPFIGA